MNSAGLDSMTFVYTPLLPVTEDQISEIAFSLGVDRDSEHVAATVEAIRRHHGREMSMAELPKGDHRARDIETLEALARAMDGLNSNVRRHLARHGVRFAETNPEAIRNAALSIVAELRAHKPRQGRKPKSSRAATLRELAAIWESATPHNAKISRAPEGGTVPAGQPIGRFFRYIRAAVAPVPGLQNEGDQALASAVERALKAK